jgi:hypothetical protein
MRNTEKPEWLVDLIDDALKGIVGLLSVFAFIAFLWAIIG